MLIFPKTAYTILRSQISYWVESRGTSHLGCAFELQQWLDDYREGLVESQITKVKNMIARRAAYEACLDEAVRRGYFDNVQRGYCLETED